MKYSNWDKFWGCEKKFDYWQKPADSVLTLIDTCDPGTQMNVLDLGCGLGRHAIAFARKGFAVTAVDSSKKALSELENTIKKNELNITIVNGNYFEPLFTRKSFDLIICYNVIYHGFKEDFKKAVDLCKEYLKPGGVLFFTCPSRDDGKYNNGKEVAPHTYESLNSVHPGDIHYFSDKDDIHYFLADLKLEYLKKNEHYWYNCGKKQFSSYWEVLANKR